MDDDPFAEVVEEILSAESEVLAPARRAPTPILIEQPRAVRIGVAWFSTEQAAALKPNAKNKNQRRKAKAAAAQLVLF